MPCDLPGPLFWNFQPDVFRVEVVKFFPSGFDNQSILKDLSSSDILVFARVALFRSICALQKLVLVIHDLQTMATYLDPPIEFELFT